MQTYTAWQGLPPEARGASAAIGNFDGVHIGHRAVLDQAREAAPGAALGVVTFEPHPREYFAPEAPPFRLMNAEARANRLAKLGVERLFQLPFDAGMAALSPEAFARDVLAGGLGLAHVTVGRDFRFGKGREAGAEDLAALGRAHGFGVTLAALVGGRGGDQADKEVSSTAIREALAEGRPREAAAMLGHWHRIEGEVLHGHKRGREMGFPTANLSLDHLHRPAFGVYAVRVDLDEGPQAGSYGGVASLGVRPTFEGGQAPNLETFLFDFTGDLYGRHISVALIEFLRPELRFDGMAELTAQMDEDAVRARAVLETLA